MNNTPTPRTDERKESFALDTIRQLETELAAVTEQRDRLAGLKYPEALTVDFVKMLIETVKGGGKVVTFNDGDICTMERIVKGGADE